MVEYERAGTIYGTKGEPVEKTAKMFREKQRRGKKKILNFYRKPVDHSDEESPAHLAGLKSGDVITHVADVPVAAWHEVRQALMKILRILH